MIQQRQRWVDQMTENSKKPLFALDIGTRSVVGVMIEENNNKYKVLDYCMQEHKERSMLDGQIHDVIAVSEVIDKVKLRLEAKYGPLHKVAVAAAGRSLKTIKASATQPISGRPLLTRQGILALELEAVQEAQKLLIQENETVNTNNDFCVGYSVIQYNLDGQEIGNLLDQRGNEASIEVIATFLPRVVVDSLLSALHRSGLEMEALTLEPIAAINVLMPATMRRLNVALVDIGAGTSDIAITAEGTITAYGMVPFAGDEITEAVSQQYVLDFTVAEKIKKQLHTVESVQFEDILTNQYTILAKDVIASIQEDIQNLAEKICREIITLNRKAPQVILLIGGGSLTPTLSKWIADIMGLPESRVGIRGLQGNDLLSIDDNSGLQGPESVTPIGIAIAAKNNPITYVSAKINDRTVSLFDLMRLTVGDAILSAGINLKKFHGKPGLALTLTVNGKLKHIPGTFGQPPKIMHGKEEIALDTPLKDQDAIEVIKGEDGLQPQASLQDVWNILTESEKMKEPPQQITVSFNGETVHVPVNSTYMWVNKKPASMDHLLKEGDHIEFGYQNVSNANKELQYHDVFRYVDVETSSTGKGKKLIMLVNDQEASLNTPIHNGDRLELKWLS